jgi:hypothetical protein
MVALPESQMVYYLTSPVLRVDDLDLFARGMPRDGRSMHVLGPEFVADDLAKQADIRVLDRSPSLLRWMRPCDRITFMEIKPQPRLAAVNSGDTGRPSRPSKLP